MSLPLLPWCGVAPRIDSARFPRYRGRSARVPGQIIEVSSRPTLSRQSLILPLSSIGQRFIRHAADR